MNQQIRNIAQVITEDPDIINENPSPLEQTRAFWQRVVSLAPAMKQAAQTQDLNALIAKYRGSEDRLADWAENEGFTFIAQQIRQKAGLDSGVGHWDTGKSQSQEYHGRLR